MIRCPICSRKLIERIEGRVWVLCRKCRMVRELDSAVKTS